MLPFQVRVDLRAMAMKGCSTFPKAPTSLEPHYHIQDSWRRRGLTTLQRCSWCILQPQPADWANKNWSTLNIKCNCNNYKEIKFSIFEPATSRCVQQDTQRNGHRCWFPKFLKRIIWRLQVQFWLQASNNTGILNTCTRL